MNRIFIFFFISLAFLSQFTSTTAEKNSLVVGPVELVWVTQQPEETSCYIALLTSQLPSVDAIKRYDILDYCLKHNHWSAFEHAYMTLQITTSRAISLQLLRHQSFRFQQYSQRYGKSLNIIGEQLPLPELRGNRGPLSPEKQQEFDRRIETLFADSLDLYKELLAAGVKSECARFILPEITPTVVHMTGNIRSWIHFIERCSHSDNQAEMIIVAEACKEIFKEIFPHTFIYLKQNRSEWGWK
jgi:thymidylate synthase (FAD)